MLTNLINTSFSTGIFPDELKTAIIVPIHKKGNTSKMNNYRPVALLSIFSKIFEKAFYRRLYSFIERHNILSDKQFGFKKGGRTQDAIVSKLMEIFDSLDDKKKVVGIYFDLSRAFDTLNHNLICDKLEAYGIRGVALQWVKNYLTGRQQVVKVTYNQRPYLSDKKAISTGVPQGSILGPKGR